jgi:intein-encoded DNA endonuclease-like protein
MTEVKKQTKPSIHTITRPLPEVLGTMIKALEEEVVSFDSYEEMVNAINQRFGVSVTEDDIIRYYTPHICMEEAKHYELYGY